MLRIDAERGADISTMKSNPPWLTAGWLCFCPVLPTHFNCCIYLSASCALTLKVNEHGTSAAQYHDVKGDHGEVKMCVVNARVTTRDENNEQGLIS